MLSVLIGTKQDCSESEGHRKVCLTAVQGFSEHLCKDSKDWLASAGSESPADPVEKIIKSTNNKSVQTSTSDIELQLGKQQEHEIDGDSIRS